MKPWWLELYTIPSLKKYLWPLLAWLVANLLCVLFFPKIREITFLAASYPWFVFLNNNEETLAANIDFHRPHLPYRELRRAIFWDLLIQTVGFLGTFFLIGYLPWLGHKAPVRIFETFGTPSMSLLIWSMILLLLLTPKLGALKQKQQERRAGMDIFSKENRFNLAMMAAIFLLFGYLYGQGLSLALLALMFTGGIVTSIFTEWYSNNFHLSPRMGHLVGGISFFLATGLCYLAVWGISSQAKLEIADEGYTKNERLSTFVLYRNFDVTLDADVLADLLEADSADLYAPRLFAQAEARTFSLEVDKVIRQPDYKLYAAYLGSGRAEERNVKALLEKSLADKKVWGHPRSYDHYRESLVKRLPAAAVLPSRRFALKKVKP